MKKALPNDQVEAYLRNKRQSGSDHENAVIDRLLADQVAMAGVYKDLLQKHEHWQPVMDAIIETAAGWSPEKIKSVRNDIRMVNGGQGIKGLNTSIKEKAVELAKLLRECDAICERSGLFPRHESLYLMNMRKLRSSGEQEFNKASLADILESLAQKQNDGKRTIDDLTAVALSVRQSSLRDFWRILDVAILQVYVSEIDEPGPFGDSALEIAERVGFSFSAEMTPWLSDISLGVLTSCVLELRDPIKPKYIKPIEPEDIKAYRASERRRNK